MGENSSKRFLRQCGGAEFNSLDAQREAVRGYIKSQAQESWTLARDEFADGGFSGGSLEGPPCSICSKLADFAKLVELFDAHGVSFV